jgi:plastocyanin
MRETGSWVAPLRRITLVIACAAGVAACGGGGGGGGTPTSPPPPPGPTITTVEIRDNQFSPRSVTIRPGDTVRWIFRGSVPGHTVTAENASFDSGQVFTQDGVTFERTFGAELENQTILYRCVSHYVCCQMQGSVRVGEGAPDPGPGY